MLPGQRCVDLVGVSSMNSCMSCRLSTVIIPISYHTYCTCLQSNDKCIISSISLHISKFVGLYLHFLKAIQCIATQGIVKVFLIKFIRMYHTFQNSPHGMSNKDAKLSIHSVSLLGTAYLRMVLYIPMQHITCHEVEDQKTISSSLCFVSASNSTQRSWPFHCIVSSPHWKNWLFTSLLSSLLQSICKAPSHVYVCTSPLLSYQTWS